MSTLTSQLEGFGKLAFDERPRVRHPRLRQQPADQHFKTKWASKKGTATKLHRRTVPLQVSVLRYAENRLTSSS